MVKKPKKIIGWREWVGLPELGIPKLKAKVDTGARTSSLHAVHLSYAQENDVTIVTFQVHPNQKDARLSVNCRLPVLEFRNVTSSNGKAEKRPVVLTEIELCGERWPIELTLTNRSQMGFRMLLGREGFRKRFLVDAGNSYYGKIK